jgi:hypothetical protein
VLKICFLSVNLLIIFDIRHTFDNFYKLLDLVFTGGLTAHIFLKVINLLISKLPPTLLIDALLIHLNTSTILLLGEHLMLSKGQVVLEVAQTDFEHLEVVISAETLSFKGLWVYLPIIYESQFCAFVD